MIHEISFSRNSDSDWCICMASSSLEFVNGAETSSSLRTVSNRIGCDLRDSVLKTSPLRSDHYEISSIHLEKLNKSRIGFLQSHHSPWEDRSLQTHIKLRILGPENLGFGGNPLISRWDAWTRQFCESMKSCPSLSRDVGVTELTPTRPSRWIESASMASAEETECTCLAWDWGRCTRVIYASSWEEPHLGCLYSESRAGCQ
jgi:hypothetical protein